MKKKIMLTAVCALCISATNAKADNHAWYNGLFSNIDTTVGAAGAYGDYDAKAVKSNDANAMPILTFDHKRWVLGTKDGLKIKFINNDNWLLRAGANYDPGRRNSQLAKSRKGLGEIGEGAMVEADLQFRFWDGFHVGAEVSRTWADGDGVLGTVELGYQMDLTDTMKLGFKASETFADGDYMQEYFGVSADQASKTGLSQFNASSGPKHATAEVNFSWEFLEDWHWGIAGGANFLQGDAADSPVSKSDVRGYGKTSLVYKF